MLSICESVSEKRHDRTSKLFNNIWHCRTLTNLNFKNPDRVITGHQNAISLRKKLELLPEMIRETLEVFMASRTKL